MLSCRHHNGPLDQLESLCRTCFLGDETYLSNDGPTAGETKTMNACYQSDCDKELLWAMAYQGYEIDDFSTDPSTQGASSKDSRYAQSVKADPGILFPLFETNWLDPRRPDPKKIGGSILDLTALSLNPFPPQPISPFLLPSPPQRSADEEVASRPLQPSRNATRRRSSTGPVGGETLAGPRRQSSPGVLTSTGVGAGSRRRAHSEAMLLPMATSQVQAFARRQSELCQEEALRRLAGHREVLRASRAREQAAQPHGVYLVRTNAELDFEPFVIVRGEDLAGGPGRIRVHCETGARS